MNRLGAGGGAWQGGAMEQSGAAATGWHDPDHVKEYLERVGTLPPRLAGEAVLVEVLPDDPTRVLDLACGDGRLAAVVLGARPSISEVIAVDRSEPMLAKARERFADDPRVEVRAGDLADPLGPLGRFDLIVSGFAIHHLDHPGKQRLFAEVAAQLNPGGTFANLEVVASATPELHAEFRRAIGRAADDPEDLLAPVDDQLGWMRDAGLVQVDCLWRWRGFALLAGQAPEHI